MSTLVWTPAAADARTVRVTWRNASLPYVVHWGDGDKTECDVDSGPVLHTYAAEGTYDVVAVAERDYTAAARITIRQWAKPPEPKVTATGREVTLTMPEVATPVGWRIEWGDGETSEHTTSTAQHTYPWNTAAPEITVTDLPSKRAVRFTGPSVGPEPDPEPSAPVRGFYFEYVSAASDSRRIRLRGGGLKPGEKITWYPYSCAWYRDVVADSNGEITDEIDWLKGINWEFDDSWRSFTVSHSGGRAHVPYHGPHLENGTPDVVYDVHVDGDPQKVALSCYPVMIGWHTIDFGDGQTTRVHSATLPLRVEHRYAGSGPYNVTITLPDGRSATGQVKGAFPCEPRFNPNYPGRCSLGWNLVASSSHPACGDPHSGPYAPVVIDNGHHPPHQLHRPDNRTGWQVVYGYTLPVGKHTFRYSTFGKATTSEAINIAKAASERELRDEIELMQIDDGHVALSVEFGEVTEWDGGYSGYFTIRNEGTEETPWVLEFGLADPAYLREVWGAGSSRYEELTGGRWRIWSDTPIPAGTDARVGVRVEPSGQPRGPQGMTVRKGRM